MQPNRQMYWSKDLQCMLTISNDNIFYLQKQRSCNAFNGLWLPIWYNEFFEDVSFCFEIIYCRLCRPFKGFLIRLQYFQLKYCLNNLINGMDFICYENSLKHESFISHKIDIKCNHKQEQFCSIQINTLTISLNLPSEFY